MEQKLVLAPATSKHRKHFGVLRSPGGPTHGAFVYPDEMVKAIQAAEGLGRTCGYEADHTHHVTQLALQLFDGLHKLHHLGPTQRFYLECAAILHDIGWVEGWKGHHKTALRIILRTSLLPLEHHERLIIGSVARYHTRALPDLQHDHFAALSPADRRVVLVLAACLRVADALDRTHCGEVETLGCRISRRKIRILYRAENRQRKNEKAALKNSDLMKTVFDREVILRWKTN